MALKKMMQGEKYTRTFNTEATDYFLTNIYKDYGRSALKNAIKAAKLHVQYYEGLGRGSLNSIKQVIERHENQKKYTDRLYPDEVFESEKLAEGQKKKIFVNTYERNIKARQKCLEHYGLECSICNMNFEQMYGEIGKGFIHVHHIQPISDSDGEYEIDPIKDLRPVCPNCHAMLHRQNPPLTIKELREIINA